MKMKWQTLWLTVLALMLMIPAAAQAQAPAAANKPLKINSTALQLVFDGKTIQLPTGQYLFVNKGTSYVPVRFISYALQKSVKWDNKVKKIMVSEPTSGERTVLQEYLMNAAGIQGQASSVGNVTLTASPIEASFVFDGAVRALPAGQSAYIINNSVYVPVRFMSESIGTDIKWDSAGQRIVGESQAYREAQQPHDDKGEENGEGAGNEQATNTGTGAVKVTGGGLSGGGGGIVSTKPTEAEIKADAEQQLQTLYSTAQTKFLSLAQQYVSAADKSTKQSIYDQGKAYLTEITTHFNQVLAQTEEKLKANGYSTEIIKEYQVKFDSELEAGRQMLEKIMSQG